VSHFDDQNWGAPIPVCHRCQWPLGEDGTCSSLSCADYFRAQSPPDDSSPTLDDPPLTDVDPKEDS